MTTGPADPATAVRAAVARFNAGDVDGYLDHFTTDCPHHLVDLGVELARHDFADSMAALLRGFADCRLHEAALTATGSYVSARWLTTGVHTGDFLGVAPTGASVAVESLEVYRLNRDGLVEASWVFGDSTALLEQITADPTQERP